MQMVICMTMALKSNKKGCFQLSLLGLIGIGAGHYTSQGLIFYLSSGITAASVIGYIICSHKLNKWMKCMHEKRRE